MSRSTPTSALRGSVTSSCAHSAIRTDVLRCTNSAASVQLEQVAALDVIGLRGVRQHTTAPTRSSTPALSSLHT